MRWKVKYNIAILARFYVTAALRERPDFEQEERSLAKIFLKNAYFG